MWKLKRVIFYHQETEECFYFTCVCLVSRLKRKMLTCRVLLLSLSTWLISLTCLLLYVWRSFWHLPFFFIFIFTSFKSVFASSSEGAHSCRSPLNLNVQNILNNIYDLKYAYRIWIVTFLFCDYLFSSSCPQFISPNLSLHPAGSFLQLLWVSLYFYV